jgi:hypothetical protein
MRLTLDRFLAAVAAKAECPAPAYADVTQVILERVGKDLASWEARTLKKACIAVISRSGRMTAMELSALGPDASALLRAFVQCRDAGHYSPVELFAFERQLRRISALAH